MTDAPLEKLIAEATQWWTTEIIDIHPGKIVIRGYPIEELIGQLTFPQMIWLMVRGDLPTPDQALLLDAALVASVDHGPHAPSIAVARMAVTCGAELNGAMASAINVLADVHGGAGQQCMELYEHVCNEMLCGAPLAAAVDKVLDRHVAEIGKIIPGFGHRWHPVDPRVAPLLGLAEAAVDAKVVSGQFIAIGREIERGLKRRTGKPIPMNIDGVTAVIFSELGFAPPMGRGLFILSRSVGILAHAWEQTQQGGRIKGPMPKCIPYTYAGHSERSLDQAVAGRHPGK